MKMIHQVDDAWVMQAMSTAEAQQFWLDNAALCLDNASGPSSSTLAVLQNQVSTLADVVATKDTTISHLQQQQAQVVDPAAYQALLQEVGHLRRFRDATSVAAQTIMGSLNDLSGKFNPSP
ncbi:MAG: hypothetical protein Q9187_009337 [Circinaria calcarea]